MNSDISWWYHKTKNTEEQALTTKDWLYPPSKPGLHDSVTEWSVVAMRSMWYGASGFPGLSTTRSWLSVPRLLFTTHLHGQKWIWSETYFE